METKDLPLSPEGSLIFPCQKAFSFTLPEGHLSLFCRAAPVFHRLPLLFFKAVGFVPLFLKSFI